MSHEIPQQRTENYDSYSNPPFSRSALAAVARTRAATTVEQSNQIHNIEMAFATGVLAVESLDITTELI